MCQFKRINNNNNSKRTKVLALCASKVHTNKAFQQKKQILCCNEINEKKDHSNESDVPSGRRNQTNDNSSQSNERTPPPVAAPPVAQEEERPGNLVPIGSGRTLVRRNIYSMVNWQSYSTATRTLLRALFSRTVLSTHCLTGKRSPAFPDKPAKMCLDKQKVTDIIIEVRERFEVKENIIRNIIKAKCADESRMWKKRQMRQ